MEPISYRLIRVRRTLGQFGDVSLARTVHCAARASTPTLESCLECAHADGLVVDGKGRETHVRCTRRFDSRLDGEAAAGSKPYTAAGATPLLSVMTPSVWCVAPSVAAGEVRALLDERHIGCAPVVDGEGHPLGVISRADLSCAQPEKTVAEVMTPLAFTLAERAPLAHAAAMMAIEGVHHLPVVDEGGRVVGILSALDVAAWVARQEGYVV